MKSTIYRAFTCSVIAFLLLLIFQPFGINGLEHDKFWFVLGEAVISFLVVVITNYLFYSIIPWRKGNSVREIILNLLPIYLINVPLITAGLMAFNFVFQGVSWYDAWHYHMHLRGILEMNLNVLWVSLFVMAFHVYYLRNQYLKKELEEVRAFNALLEQRQERLEKLAETSSTEPEQAPEPQRCLLSGNANNATLEVNPEEIIYIESMSNYADICYLDAGEVKHKTLRITMKQLREALAGIACLVPCHRAFLVNLNFVTSMSIRPTGGYQVELLSVDKVVPVSRTYTDEIKQKLK